MGDAGDSFAALGAVGAVVVVVVVVAVAVDVVERGFSNRDMSPREPRRTLFAVDCWALSCNF